MNTLKLDSSLLKPSLSSKKLKVTSKMLNSVVSLSSNSRTPSSPSLKRSRLPLKSYPPSTNSSLSLSSKLCWPSDKTVVLLPSNLPSMLLTAYKLTLTKLWATSPTSSLLTRLPLKKLLLNTLPLLMFWKMKPSPATTTKSTYTKS